MPRCQRYNVADVDGHVELWLQLNNETSVGEKPENKSDMKIKTDV